MAQFPSLYLMLLFVVREIDLLVDSEMATFYWETFVCCPRNKLSCDSKMVTFYWERLECSRVLFYSSILVFID